MAGKTLPIKYITYINQQSSISSNTVAVQVARAVTKLQSAFITLYKTPAAGTATILDKQAIKFYHPMEGTFSTSKDLEFQLQIGNKLIPEYPCKAISERFYYFKQTMNLPEWAYILLGLIINDILIINSFLHYPLRRYPRVPGLV